MQIRKSSPKPVLVRNYPSFHQFAENNFTANIFKEDIHLGIMPFRARSSEKNAFSIVLKGLTDHCTRAEQLIEKIAGYDRHDSAENICLAIEQIAKQLSWSGCSFYEIVYDEEHVPHPYFFTSRNLIRIFEWYLYIIPKKSWKHLHKKVIFIQSKKLWKINMPQDLGGQRKYAVILKKLNLFDPLGPKFWINDLEDNIKSEFNFQDYIRMNNIHQTKVTRIWGWNKSDSRNELTTEFFYFYKFLTFRWAQAVLREHIILQLNLLFSKLEINCTLIMNGICTSNEILEIRKSMISGDITFSAAYEKVSFS